jgi:RND superfamily putative drug exporter
LVGAFPAGVLSPAHVYVVSDGAKLTQDIISPLTKRLASTQGVANLMPATFAPDGKTADIPVVLTDDPYSANAIKNVAGPIRTAAHDVKIDGSNTYVGGMTSIIVDMKAVTDRDLRVLFPIAAAFIFIILTILLRSLVAPVFLLLGVGLGYVATVGATVLIFMNLGSASGLIFFIPLFMYIFVVAIGTDYNILTITRLREEIRAGNKPRHAADLTIEHSSATVVSAGLILAATFASMLLAGVNFLSQMGAAIAIGVSIAAFLVAPLLIPSVTAVLGYAIWWPGHKPNNKKK